MSSRNVSGIFGGAIGIAVILSMIVIVWNIFPDDSEMEDFAIVKYFFLLFMVLMLAAMIRNMYKMIRSAKHTQPPVRYDNDLMNYERGDRVRYCPYCNANLGASDPSTCPECRRKFRNDIYRQ